MTNSKTTKVHIHHRSIFLLIQLEVLRLYILNWVYTDNCNISMYGKSKYFAAEITCFVYQYIHTPRVRWTISIKKCLDKSQSWRFIVFCLKRESETEKKTPRQKQRETERLRIRITMEHENSRMYIAIFFCFCSQHANMFYHAMKVYSIYEKGPF